MWSPCVRFMRQQWWNCTDPSHVLSFPLRTFFRHSRDPLLAWQSEQIWQLNLSELLQRATADFSTRSRPTRTLSSTLEFALALLPQIRLIRSCRSKAENRPPGNVPWTNERTNVRTHARTHAPCTLVPHSVAMRADARIIGRDWLSMYAVNYRALIARIWNDTRAS